MNTKLQPITQYEGLPLSNTENYGAYKNIAKGKNVKINTKDINKDNWLSHYTAVLILLRYGIETEEVQSLFIKITFADNVTIDLTIPDYLINLMMWNMILSTGTPIESKHIFFDKEITTDSIKDYIDKNLIDVFRKKFTNKELNNIIDDTLCHFHDIDEFAMYLSNTVN